MLTYIEIPSAAHQVTLYAVTPLPHVYMLSLQSVYRYSCN